MFDKISFRHVNPSKSKKSGMDQTYNSAMQQNHTKLQNLPIYYQTPRPYDPKFHQPVITQSRSDAESKDAHKRRFFGNFFRKKKESSDESTSESDLSKKKSHTSLNCTTKKSQYPLQSPRLTKMISNEHLNRPNLYRHNLIGIPHKPLGSSISYDSLPASGLSMNSESAYGSITSIKSHSGFDGRSPSLDGINRKEKREMMMAKVSKLRDVKDSSSDEDKSLCGSETSFSSGSLSRRSKSSRTERYLRRKTREFENLKKESEKDKRNKEAVQSRILEIQRARKLQSSQEQKNPLAEKPRWSAHLVYQESNEFDSVVVPTPIPYALSSSKNIPNSNFPRTYSQTDVDRFRAINTVGVGSNHSPPVPPPRDASRYFNQLHRPMSYSFENIHHVPPRPSKKHYMSLSPCSSIGRPYHSTYNHRRAASEQRLAIPQSPKEISPDSSLNSSFISSPVPIKTVLTIKPMYTAQPYVAQNHSKPEEKTSIISMPPSPSSDYSSYISENSSAQRFSPQSFSKPFKEEPKTPTTKYKTVIHLNETHNNNTEKILVSQPITPPSRKQQTAIPAPCQQKTTNSVSRQQQTTIPAPPVRDSSSISKTSKENIKQRFFQTLEQTKNSAVIREKLEDVYKKEKDRIIKAKSKNFEQALNELEDLYKQLNLQSDDILDRAERRDLPTEHQLMWPDKKDVTDGPTQSDKNIAPVKTPDRGRSRSHTPRLRRSYTPDKVTDDYHYRRLNKLPNKVKNYNLPTGSYMLMSPVHATTKSYYEEGSKPNNEPDIISDDVTVKNIQRANSIKTIEPQPPFGVPIGPTTQSSSSDYLHIEAKENYKPMMINRRQPDAAMDDLAFRKLRKENSLSEKSVNLSELDTILSESIYNKKKIRSHSVGPLPKSNPRSAPLSPRRIKEVKKSKSKFYESYRGSFTDTENVQSAEDLIDNYSIKCAKECDDTSTETLTEQSVTKHNEQVRDAIIREATCPPGGPLKQVPGTPANIERIPTDPSTRLGHTNSPVNIEELNDLISTIKSEKSSTDSTDRPKSQFYPSREPTEGNERRHSSVDFPSFCSTVVSNIVFPVFSRAEPIFMPGSQDRYKNPDDQNDRQEPVTCQGEIETEPQPILMEHFVLICYLTFCMLFLTGVDVITIFSLIVAISCVALAFVL